MGSGVMASPAFLESTQIKAVVVCRLAGDRGQRGSLRNHAHHQLTMLSPLNNAPHSPLLSLDGDFVAPMPNSNSMPLDHFQSLVDETDVPVDKVDNLICMKAAFAQMTVRKDGLKESVRELSDRVGNLKEIQGYKRFDRKYQVMENETLLKEKATLEERVTALETLNDEQASELQGLKRTCAGLATENQDLKRANAAQATWIEMLQTANTAQATRIETLETTNAAQATRIETLETANAALNRRVAALEDLTTKQSQQFQELMARFGSK